MALIEFKDLPDTSTPIIAANLNNNFNHLKNFITTNISTYTTTNHWVDYDPSKEVIPSGYTFLFRIPIPLNGIGITWFSTSYNNQGQHIAYTLPDEATINFLNVFVKTT